MELASFFSGFYVKSG